MVLGLGLLSALGGVLYALVQHDLKRLLAFSSIENVGIVALGLGASILFASEGDSTWAAIAFAAALLHILNHAVFKALLFLAAGAFERAVGSLDLDRIGGLLRRMPWTGGAFLIGSMAIAGLPPLNGFASEWLTLQALIHVAFGPSLGLGLAGALATAGLAATAALAVFCFVKVVGLVLLGSPRRAEAEAAVEAPAGMRAAPVFLAGCCIALGAVPGLLIPSLMELAPQPRSLAAEPGLSIPGTGSLPSPWLLLGLLALSAMLWRLRGSRRAAPAPAWACGQPIEPALNWSSAGFTKPLRLVLESVLRPRREIEAVHERGQLQSIRYRGEIPHLFDTLLYGPVQRGALAGALVARRLQSGSVRAYAAYLLALLLGLARPGAGRSDRMSALAGAIQILGGLALAPLLPGTIQALKARLQGRRGPSPLQPYRELRRLWGKTLVDPQPTTRRLPAGALPGGRGDDPRPVPGADRRPLSRLAAGQRRARPRRAARPGAVRAGRGQLGHRVGVRADGIEPRPDPLGLRRGAAGPGADPRRAARRQHRPGGDERRRERLGDLERAGPLVRRARPSPSSSWSRPGASRSTTPTPISS